MAGHICNWQRWHAPYGSLGSAAYSELINKSDTFAAQSHVFSSPQRQHGQQLLLCLCRKWQAKCLPSAHKLSVEQCLVASSPQPSRLAVPSPLALNFVVNAARCGLSNNLHSSFRNRIGRMATQTRPKRKTHAHNFHVSPSLSSSLSFFLALLFCLN